MKARFFAVVCALALLLSVVAASQRTLVLLDDLEDKSSFSRFFDSLSNRGYDLTYVEAEDNNVDIFEYGTNIYDNIIIFAPTAETFASADYRGLLQFVDKGGNVIVAADNTYSDSIRDFVMECGIKVDPSNTMVIDNSNYAPKDMGDHSLITSDNFLNARVVWGGPQPARVVYRGVALSLDAESELVLPLLRAEHTSQSHAKRPSRHQPPSAQGTDIVLAAALQARNNARVVVVGSLEAFTDEFADMDTSDGKRSGNADFAVAVATWAFKERGLLRGSNVHHHKAGETEQQSLYRVMDEIVYHVDIEEHNGTHWRPYMGTDVQMEFVMLDPRVRISMRHDGRGHYSAQFTTPDVYGVYQFKVNYNRVGYSYLQLADTVTVRPFRHNEYERFIAGAFPYYAGALSIVGMFALFCFVFLFSRPAASSSKPKTE